MNTGNPELEAFIQVLNYALGPGAGVVVKRVLDWLIGEIEDPDTVPPKKVSPRTKRRLSYVVTIVVPSVLYGLLALSTWQWNWAAFAMNILSAFAVSQVVHGEQNLQTGAQMRAEEKLEEFKRMPMAGEREGEGEGEGGDNA